MRVVVLFLLFWMFLPACGEEGPPALVLTWNASRTEMDRAAALSRAGSPEAARKALEAAFRHAGDVHRALSEGVPPEARGPGLPDRVDVLIRLAEVSLLLGRDDPDYLVRAIRISFRGIKEDPEHPAPYGLFGSALSSVGCLGRASDNLEKHRRLLPDGTETPGRMRLAQTLVDRAAQVLRTGEPGCESYARRYLTRARELLPEPDTDPRVMQGLEALNMKYAEEANDAAGRGLMLELARVHSRYGFLDLAEEILQGVVKRSGVVGEVRWVVARFLYEEQNTKDSLEKAKQVYEEIILDEPDGEPGIAGWVRVQRRLGNIDLALERYGAREAPGEDLRVELILTLFDRSLVRNETDFEGWKQDRRAIDRLLTGEISPRRRADLLVELGFLCLRVQDPARIERLIAEFRRAWPEDRRVLVLEAGLLDLKMESVLPEPEDRVSK